MTRVVRAMPGLPLASDTCPSREGIVGWFGDIEGAALQGAPGTLLGESSLVVDDDACFDGSGPLDSTTAWQRCTAAEHLDAVEGSFAIAWRPEDGGVTLARDALGHRSLYYAEVSGGVVFASSVHALLASGLVEREIDPSALGSFLSCAYVPGERTLVAGVRQVLPGQTVRLSTSGSEKHRYWNVPTESKAEQGEEQLRVALRAALEDAVRVRLPAAGPVAATLSGGVDSSLVVALAAQLHNEPVHTYALSFGPDYANELEHSSLVAKHCNTVHTIVELMPDAVIHHLDDTMRLMSVPIGDPLSVPNSLLFRTTAERFGVVLNGEGGDPCFGGPKNAPMVLAELLGDGREANHELRRERSFLRSHLKCFDDLDIMLAPDVRERIHSGSLEAASKRYFDDARWPGFVNKLMVMNVALKAAHNILPKVEQLGTPFGVLPRSPLLDRRLVELAFAIPVKLKQKGTVEKYLLKQAVLDLLPRAIIDRPKSGMLVPVEHWFSGPLLPAARERILDGLGSHELFDRTWLEKLLEGRQHAMRRRRGAKIWLLLVLEAWLREVLHARS